MITFNALKIWISKYYCKLLSLFSNILVLNLHIISRFVAFVARESAFTFMTGRRKRRCRFCVGGGFAMALDAALALALALDAVLALDVVLALDGVGVGMRRWL